MVWQRVRKYIEDNGILLAFVLKRTNIKKNRFYRVMSGESPMTVDEYEHICIEGLQVEPGVFLRQLNPKKSD